MKHEGSLQQAAGTEAPVLELRGISKRFQRKQDLVERSVNRLLGRRAPPVVSAVDDVSLALFRGEFLGLVGESGCGKSTLGRMAAGLLDPSEGVLLRNGEVTAAGGMNRRERTRVQMVFQDSFASLNPRLPLRELIGEAPLFHGLTTRRELDGYVRHYLDAAGLRGDVMSRYPHEFSGGQRQRICIARALAMQPTVLVCDEPVAALDVSIQAQVLNFFMELRDKLRIAFLFISHDLGVVEHICDRVAIMYLGRVVEQAEAARIFAAPHHPYTAALLNDAPRLGRRSAPRPALEGELPSPLNPPTGCHFHPRCVHATARCSIESPLLREVEAGHVSACHFDLPITPGWDFASAR